MYGFLCTEKLTVVPQCAVEPEYEVLQIVTVLSAPEVVLNRKGQGGVSQCCRDVNS